MKKEDATRLIALTLAETRSRPFEPLTSEWSDAKYLADKFEKAGYIKPEVEQEEMTVYGYGVVDREGKFIKACDSQQEAIEYAEAQTQDCYEADINWSYRVAAIVDQGGL